jgi:glycerophosphoryl diester phosphodiesterase
VLKSLIVDGEDHTNDSSITDFTMAELKNWIAGTTYDAANERPKVFNGKLPIISFQDVIDIAKAKSKETGRPIAVYPETKNPTWNNAQAIANGCGAPGSHPFEDALIKIIKDNGLNSKEAPIFVQSFEPGSLKYMRSHGLETRQVQLIDGNGIDFKAGKILNNNITNSRPFDWTVSGDPRLYDAMVTPEGLAEIKTYADGIGPWKPYIVPLKISPWKDSNADGTPYKGSTPEASTQEATSLVADAHKLGLFVHVFTFRNEKKYLAADYRSDPSLEYLKFFRLGVDGVFTDFTHTGVPHCLYARAGLVSPAYGLGRTKRNPSSFVRRRETMGFARASTHPRCSTRPAVRNLQGRQSFSASTLRAGSSGMLAKLSTAVASFTRRSASAIRSP